MRNTNAQRVLGALIVAAALAACGGGDGGTSTTGSSGSGGNAGSGGGNSGGSGNGGSVTPTAVTYMGVISFGDTIAVTLDSPAAGKLKIRFVDSTFGLGGTLVGDYTLSGGVYAVSHLAADSADPPPAFVSAVLSGISATFTVSGATLSGEIAGLPKQLGGGKLSGHVTASSVSTATSLASLAGLYTFQRTQSTYYASSGNLQIQYGMVGQTRIDADGTVRMCQTSAYSDTCSGLLTGALTLADQTRYPGAYALTMGGKVWGRVFPLQQGNVQTLYFDHNQLDTSSNQITGSGVFRPAQTLTMDQVTGTWTCSQPSVGVIPITGIGMPLAPDGTLQSETLTISASGEITSATSAQTSSLALNYAGNLLGYTALAAVPGAMSADWIVPAIPPAITTGIRTQTFLPIDANAMAYYAEVKGQRQTAQAVTVDWTYIAQGTCRRG